MGLRNGNNSVRVERRALEAPRNLMEVIFILAEAIMLFCYTERRYIFNLPRAIARAALDEGEKTIGSECGETCDCVEVKGLRILKELYELKRMLTRAKLFSSSKRFLAFLLAAGFEEEDVLYRKRKSRILKPAFTVIRDKESKCFLVFIRGTHSIKDTLTDALCAPVSFEHFICSDGGEHDKHNKVSGHAHRGMAAAADRIRKRCRPILLEALRRYPHFKIKIVGHSLGGGTAALLAYKLREIPEFSSTTCVTFGPAACMTLELAEFGKSFITSIVNGSDIVPTLSASSVHDFIEDGRIEDKNILTAVGSRLPFAKRIAGHALKCCTKVAKNIDKLSETSFESLLSEEHLPIESIDEYNSSSEVSDSDDSDEDEDQLLNQVGKLKLGKHVSIPNIHANEENIIEEERVYPVTTSKRRRLYPPGRILHIVTSHLSENSNSDHCDAEEKHVLYKTPTHLYGKLRFSRRMILDHPTNQYLRSLQQLINQLEEEHLRHESKNSK